MRILRANQVIEKTGLSRPTIFRREREGTFPARRQIGPGSVGWIEDEIDRWIETREVVQLGGAVVRG